MRRMIWKKFSIKNLLKNDPWINHEHKVQWLKERDIGYKGFGDYGADLPSCMAWENMYIRESGRVHPRNDYQLMGSYGKFYPGTWCDHYSIYRNKNHDVWVVCHNYDSGFPDEKLVEYCKKNNLILEKDDVPWYKSATTYIITLDKTYWSMSPSKLIEELKRYSRMVPKKNKALIYDVIRRLESII